MKRFLLVLPVAVAVSAALVGCSAQTPTNEARSLASSFVVGRAFDRVQSATRAAMQLEAEAKFAPLARQSAIFERALEKYRAASAFLPANPKPGEVDADTLNMVGYPLADRGTTRADWERARQLTQLSLDASQKQINATPPGSDERLRLEAGRTLGALDSNAWALFKLGKINEALEKQEKVMAFVAKYPGTLTAEIPYHMAQIYRAAGRDEEAREQFAQALQLGPDRELLMRIDSALNGTQI